MKRLWIIIPLFFALGFGLMRCANAQAATTSVVLDWTPPTLNSDGSAITGALTYNLYQGPKAGPFVKVGNGVAGVTSTITTLAAGNCFQITAVEQITPTSTSEGLPSGVVCAIQPGVPGGLSISVTVKIGGT